MNLYDFSAYAKQRTAQQLADRVQESVTHINEPGAVIELKHQVHSWFALHLEILNLQKITKL